jgi:hypothetical protein
MRIRTFLGLTIGPAVLFALPTASQSQPLIAASQPASTRAIYAEVVVLGKVTEIEKETIEGPAYVGAPKDQKATYKIAVVKIEDPLIGARGLTQLRVGFLADGLAAAPMPGDGGPPVLGGGRPVPGRLRGAVAAVALIAGQEGCFFLDPLPGSDFYISSSIGPPLNKKDETFEKDMKAVQAVVKAIDDPVAALKAKDLNDRFRAAQAILQKHQTARGNRTAREAVPEQENKLLLGVLAELPWLPKEAPAGPGEVVPSRSALWHAVNWSEHGFKQPKNAPGVDFNKVMDDATTAFLKENAEKIKLKRLVAK